MLLRPRYVWALATALFVLCVVGPAQARQVPERCTYKSFSWSVVKKRAVAHEAVNKPYAQVTDAERDPDDPRCSVCSEDQVELDLSAVGLANLGSVKVCWAHAAGVKASLLAVLRGNQFQVVSLEGYRPGKSRGAVANGLRTQWSNHAFGTAIDINARYNGLYRRCDVKTISPETIARCSLGVGGAWDPRARPLVSITEDGAVVRAFREHAGWRWGGEISGGTRDLMHFSITGF